MKSSALNNRLRLMAFIGFVLVMGCSAVQTISDRDRPRGYLELLVEPDHAEVILNSDYHGRVNGWVEGVIPVIPGAQRLELRAEGYMTQRFDLKVRANEQVTLEVRMEPELDEYLDGEQALEGGAALNDLVAHP